jgi:hypothetical protein
MVAERTHRKQPLYCWGVFTAGMCLPSRCLEMDAHVTITISNITIFYLAKMLNQLYVYSGCNSSDYDYFLGCNEKSLKQRASQVTRSWYWLPESPLYKHFPLCTDALPWRRNIVPIRQLWCFAGWVGTTTTMRVNDQGIGVQFLTKARRYLFFTLPRWVLRIINFSTEY